MPISLVAVCVCNSAREVISGTNKIFTQKTAVEMIYTAVSTFTAYCFFIFPLTPRFYCKAGVIPFINISGAGLSESPEGGIGGK